MFRPAKAPGKALNVLLAMFFLFSSACSSQPEASDTPAKPDVTPFGSSPVEKVDGYVVAAPRTLRAGQTEAISFSLLRGDRLVNSHVTVALVGEGKTVASASGPVDGKGFIALPVPRLAEGEYQLAVSGNGFQDQAPIRVEDGMLIFLETDKPVYKPGQTAHIRVLTLDAELKPLPGEVTVEVQDAKGIKVFKTVIKPDDFGMGSVDLPLSTEPNLGAWKITARSGQRLAQVDVKVEEYVLPKYEIKVNLAKDWLLASERLTGTVSAEYSFGKPVKGEVVIKAARYVGAWQEFARVTKPLDGNVSFDVPEVGYVAGVPGSKGLGNVSLEVIVREHETGYEEKTTRLLTVAASPVNLQIIPESGAFKPSLPLNLLLLAETPDRKPTDATVKVNINYLDKQFGKVTQETHQVAIRNGKSLLQVVPPQGAAAMAINAADGRAATSLNLEAGYSPSGNFIHVEQVGQGTSDASGASSALKVGGVARFKVTSTKEAANYYYEVLGRGKVVYSGVSRSPEIEVTLTPSMAPSARLIVYQILPNGEVAADYLPFTVLGDYPQEVAVSFGRDEVKPGDAVDINVATRGPSKVGLAAVDRSVFILAENRTNLQQVFDELERLYMKPQVELHSARLLDNITVRGAQEIFQDAGIVVMSNKTVPRGEKYESPARLRAFDVAPAAAREAMPLAAQPTPEAKATDSAGATTSLAEVQRIRQFFPETWLWQEIDTDAQGKATTKVTAPDSITTWMLRAVALSKEYGLGVAENQLRVFQPFFTQVDLPYSAVRGEEFPVRVSLYNYQDTRQEFFVELENTDWFDLLDEGAKPVAIDPNNLGGVTFNIRPTRLGVNKLKVTARSATAADAIVKELIVEPEGVARELVENLILSPGSSRAVSAAIPADAVSGSGRVSLALTGSYLTQSIDGLERLLQMPFGCGEQNMILFAPNVFVSRYLKQTGQFKPEVMAKAEKMMITGYQRELIYRRDDGSFSAFGQQDKEGSLWLTAFVLKTLAQSRDLIYIDDEILRGARSWILQHQKPDGSFDPVGFVTHKELLGGLNGKTALTAYVAIALKESGDDSGAGKAIRYLEGQLETIEDAYTAAIVAYALEVAKSPRTDAAIERLMRMAKEDENGLHWGEPVDVPVPLPGRQEAPGFAPERIAPVSPGGPNRSAAIETTGYAALALIERGDRINAGKAARWLVSQRNAYGGFGSTQDTVVGLQALTRYATDAQSDVDVSVTLKSGAWSKEVRITPQNADVLQVIEAPVSDAPMASNPGQSSLGALTIETRGRGQVVAQVVRRFNVPEPERQEVSAFQIEVDYGAANVQVDDTIDISTTVKFTPPLPMDAEMVIVDVAIPTGFAPIKDSIAALLKQQPKIKRFEIAGRKVVFYIEEMRPEEKIGFEFQARALFPVKAQAATSQAYSYYRPEWKGESLGGQIVAED